MRPLTLLAALLSLACSAQAAPIKINFAGVNSSPTAANVFGQPVTTVSGYLIYDDETPGLIFSTFNGLTMNYANAIKEISFDMGSGVFTGEASGSFGSAQVRDGQDDLPDRFSFNNMVLGPLGVVGEPAGFRTAQLTLGLASTVAALTTADLLGEFDPVIFNGQKNLSVFISRAAGSQPTGVAISFNFNLTDIAVSSASVPEPGMLGLFSLSLAGLVAARRRARRQSHGLAPA